MSRFWSIATNFEDYERWQQAPVLTYLRTIQLRAAQTHANQKYHEIIKRKW